MPQAFVLTGIYESGNVGSWLERRSGLCGPLGFVLLKNFAFGVISYHLHSSQYDRWDPRIGSSHPHVDEAAEVKFLGPELRHDDFAEFTQGIKNNLR